MNLYSVVFPNQIIKRNKKQTFLQNLFTGDEKWICYRMIIDKLIKYCKQLENSKNSFVKKRLVLVNRRRKVFYYNNLRPAKFVTTIQFMRYQFQCLVISFSKSKFVNDLQNYRKNFESLEDIKIYVDRFFVDFNETF